jgi:hypothetical protein
VGAPPDFHFWEGKFIINWAVLCAAGDVHGSCHSSPFQVSLVAYESNIAQVYARIYSSQTGVWGNISELALQLDHRTPCSQLSTLVGGSLYWKIPQLVSGGILELDLSKQSLALIELPPDLSDHGSRFLTMPGEDGGLGLVSVSGVHAQLWKREKVDFIVPLYGCQKGALIWANFFH